MTEEEEDIVKWCAGALYAGAADTVSLIYAFRAQLESESLLQTVSAMISFIMLMALHPSVQHRARDEIDSIVGLGRVPRVADVGRLPYLLAVSKEVMRYAPVANLGQ
jgi:hypothetical protein